MGRRAALIAIAVVLLGLAGAWLLSSVRRERAAREALAEVAKRRVTMEVRISRLSAPGPKPAGSRLARNQPGPQRQATAAKFVLSAVDRLLNDPALQARYFAAKRAEFGVAFAPLYRKLGLSGQQIATFEDILVKHEEAKVDVLAAVPGLQRSAHGNDDPLAMDSISVSPSLLTPKPGESPDADAAAAQTLYAQEEESFAQAATDLLGTDGYRQYDEFLRSAPARGFVTDLADNLAGSEDPLGGAQTEQLVQILAASSARFQQGGTANLDDSDWTRTLAQAQAILTPPQFAALSRAIAPREAGRQLTAIINAEARP